MRIVFDQKGNAKKDPKKKAMIHIEIRDTVTNQKTYIPINVKILFEHHAKDGTIISSKHPNGAILRKNVQSVFNKIEDLTPTRNIYCSIVPVNLLIMR